MTPTAFVFLHFYFFSSSNPGGATNLFESKVHFLPKRRKGKSSWRVSCPCHGLGPLAQPQRCPVLPCRWLAGWPGWPGYDKLSSPFANSLSCCTHQSGRAKLAIESDPFGTLYALSGCTLRIAIRDQRPTNPHAFFRPTYSGLPEGGHPPPPVLFFLSFFFYVAGAHLLRWLTMLGCATRSTHVQCLCMLRN